METVKVDLLVIGDMMTSSYMACELEAHIIGAGNITEITSSNIPDSVNVRLNLSERAPTSPSASRRRMRTP